MLNAEKYKDELLKVINENEQDFIAFDDRDNSVKNCNTMVCKDCKFTRTKSKALCTQTKLKWLLSEYKEPIKLTRTEYSLLRHVYKLNYKYIARDKDGDISLYLDEPDKELLTEIWHGKEYEFTLFNNLFPFIKWEDKEPIRIKEVLNNCEVIEDD